MANVFGKNCGPKIINDPSTNCATLAQGALADSAVQPEDLGSAAYTESSDYATSAQGALADSAVQPEDLGSAAYTESSDYATSAQGDLADSAVQPEDLGSAAYTESSDYATSAQGALADSALQPEDLCAVATSCSYLDLNNTPGIVSSTDPGFIPAPPEGAPTGRVFTDRLLWEDQSGGDELWIQNESGIHTLENVGINEENPQTKLDVGRGGLETNSWVNSLILNGEQINQEFYLASTTDPDGNVYVASGNRADRFSIHQFSITGELIDTRIYSLGSLNLPGGASVTSVVPSQIVWVGGAGFAPLGGVSAFDAGPSVIDYVILKLDLFTSDSPIAVNSVLFYADSANLLSLSENTLDLVLGMSYQSLSEEFVVAGFNLNETTGSAEIILLSGNPYDLGSYDWVKTYPIPEFAAFPLSSSFKFDSSGNIVLQVNFLQIASEGSEFGFAFSTLLVKFDSTGEELWNVVFSQTLFFNEEDPPLNFNLYSDFAIDSVDSIIMSGVKINFVPGTGPEDIFQTLTKISSTGDIDWEKNYQIGENLSLTPETTLLSPSQASIQIDADDKILTSSTIYMLGEGETQTTRVVLSEFDSAGNPLSSLQLNQETGVPLSSTLLGDSELFLPISIRISRSDHALIVLSNSNYENVSGPAYSKEAISSQVFSISDPLSNLEGLFGDLYRFTRSSIEEVTLPETDFESFSLTSVTPTEFEVFPLVDNISIDLESQFFYLLNLSGSPLLARVDGVIESDSLSTEQLLINSVPLGKTSSEKRNIVIGNGAGGYGSEDIGVNNIYIGTESGPLNGNSGSGNVFVGQYSGVGLSGGYDQNIVLGFKPSFPIDSDGGLLIGTENGTWIYGNRQFNISIGTEATDEKLNIGGKISINEATIYGSNLVSVEPSLSVVTLHQELETDYIRSVEYTVQVEAAFGEEFQVSKIMCFHNGTEVFFTQYGNMYNGDELANFQVSIDSGFIKLEATPLVESIYTYTIRFEAIRSFPDPPSPPPIYDFDSTWYNNSNLESIYITGNPS